MKRDEDEQISKVLVQMRKQLNDALAAMDYESLRGSRAYLNYLLRFTILLDAKICFDLGAAADALASFITQRSSGKVTILKPPGSYLLLFSEFMLRPKFFSSVVLPAIEDMRNEYNEALFQNRILKARWVRIRGTYSFFAAIGLDRAFAFVSFFVKAWKSVN